MSWLLITFSIHSSFLPQPAVSDPFNSGQDKRKRIVAYTGLNSQRGFFTYWLTIITAEHLPIFAGEIIPTYAPRKHQDELRVGRTSVEKLDETARGLEAYKRVRCITSLVLNITHRSQLFYRLAIRLIFSAQNADSCPWRYWQCRS